MSRILAFQNGGGIAPVPSMAVGAARYAAKMGNRRPIDYSAVRVDPAIAHSAARAYQALPDFDERAIPSFEAMRHETGRQFEFLTGARKHGGLGVSVDVVDHDPYVTQTGAPNSRALMRDLHENRHISVLSTKSTGPHPFFTNEENDQFRAVHDALGHAATGRNFTADGEEAAWLSHSSLYSPLARRAMTTETRGQNSVNNFGGLAPGEFAKQKVALIPATFADMAHSVPGRAAAARRAVLLSRQFA